MEQLKNADIERLLGSGKVITEGSKKGMTLRSGSLRNDLKLETTDGKDRFSAFIRVSESFVEDFSIGIDYITDEGKHICLMRCNGKHGEHRNHRPGSQPFYDFHIHLATEEAIDQGESPEQFAEQTNEYATWQDALRYFFERANVKNAVEYFPEISQKNLFET
jgi:hypothetical protein